MKKFDPISVLSDSLSSLKNYIDEELDQNPENSIEESFLKEISQENIQLLNLCKELNSDNTFVEKINSKVVRSNDKIFYKTEHFFLSEIILIQEQNEAKSAESDFVLAFYYDVLKNNHFAEIESLNALNLLMNTDNFKNLLAKIKSENILKPTTPTSKNILLSTLSELSHPKFEVMKNHFQTFRKLSKNEGVDEIEVPSVAISDNKSEAVNNCISNPPENDTLEKALEELNALVGLESVKKDISELINLLEIQKKRNTEGLKNIELSLHTVFLGPPGTGKTTVARLLGRIFKHLKYLTIGQLYETDREGLVAGYVGQTAIKTDKVLDESIGGVVFIDEAYSLTQNVLGNDFGSEAVNTIIKRMEDNRDDLAVVVAGYTEPMQVFIESNPGLRSRFNRYFYFEHFATEQLLQIFENFCKTSDFQLATEARTKVLDTFALMEEHKTDSFGNARVVRNLFEKTVQKQANRLIYWSAPKDEQLRMLYEEDIPEPNETLESIKNYFPEEDDKEDEV